jgi:hypothetical protein
MKEWVSGVLVGMVFGLVIYQVLRWYRKRYYWRQYSTLPENAQDFLDFVRRTEPREKFEKVLRQVGAMSPDRQRRVSDWCTFNQALCAEWGGLGVRLKVMRKGEIVSI